MIPGVPNYGGGMYMQPQFAQPGSLPGAMLGMPPGAGVPFDLGSGPMSQIASPAHGTTPYFTSPTASFTARQSIHQDAGAAFHNSYSNADSVERNTPENNAAHPGSPQLRPNGAPGSRPRSAQQVPPTPKPNGNGANGFNGTNSSGTRAAGGQNGSQSAAAKKKVNYYEIVGVAQDAKDDEIKKAYRKKAIQMHPDKNPDDPEAEQKFALLSEAYTNLMDPVKRIDHNKDLAGGNAGWGWNQEAAKARASNYQWNGDDMVFNLGAQMQAARQRKKSGPFTRCFEGIFGYR